MNHRVPFCSCWQYRARAPNVAYLSQVDGATVSRNLTRGGGGSLMVNTEGRGACVPRTVRVYPLQGKQALPGAVQQVYAVMMMNRELPRLVRPQ